VKDEVAAGASESEGVDIPLLRPNELETSEFLAMGMSGAEVLHLVETVNLMIRSDDYAGKSEGVTSPFKETCLDWLMNRVEKGSTPTLKQVITRAQDKESHRRQAHLKAMMFEIAREVVDEVRQENDA